MLRMWRALSVGCLVAGLMSRVAVGHAQAPVRAQAPTTTVGDELAVRLIYSREEGLQSCPDEAQLRAAVHLHLGYAVFDREPPTRELVVSVKRVRSRFVARMELRSMDGVSMGARELDARGSVCDELAAALGLAIAVALDPTPLMRGDAADAPAPPAAATCPESTPCPVCPAQPTVQSPAPAPDPKSTTWSIGLIGALGFGVLPETALALGVSASLDFDDFGVLLEGVVYPNVTAESGAIALDTQTQILRVGACGTLLGDDPLLVAGCALGSIGALRVESPIAVERDITPTGTLGARLLGQAHLVGPLWVELRADAHANLIRTTVSLQDRGLWTSPALLVELGCGLRMRFL